MIHLWKPACRVETWEMLDSHKEPTRNVRASAMFPHASDWSRDAEDSFEAIQPRNRRLRQTFVNLKPTFRDELCGENKKRSFVSCCRSGMLPIFAFGVREARHGCMEELKKQKKVLLSGCVHADVNRTNLPGRRLIASARRRNHGLCEPTSAATDQLPSNDTPWGKSRFPGIEYPGRHRRIL